MPKSSNQKLKILYLMKILLDKTDDEHSLSVQDMIAELELYGIKAERKSIYDDLETLEQYGLDIVCYKSKVYTYSIGKRTFELPEMKLLVDAVQSSKFITHKKSAELIKKIESLASKNEAKQLQRQVFVTNRVKTMNERIYYNVDMIHGAINNRKQIAFRYFEWNVDKEKRFRKNGEKYTVSPLALTWDDENYYLITYSKKYDSLVHYRVDKMSDIEILDIKREEMDKPDQFDLAVYAKKVFGMFGGQEETVKLQFSNSLVGVIIDRFGRDVFIEKADDEHFIVNLKVAVSPVFLAWVIGFGKQAKVISPKKVAEQIKALCAEALAIYEVEENA